MDIFAHGLWGAAAIRGINIARRGSGKRHLSPWVGAMFGMLPDLVPFAPVTLYAFAHGITRPEQFMMHTTGIMSSGIAPYFSFAHSAYTVTHSLVVFAAVFLVVLWIKKRPQWEMIGWGIHILADIPTHTLAFFPTQFLWPISTMKYDGTSWGTPGFMIANYSALVFTFFLLSRREKRS